MMIDTTYRSNQTEIMDDLDMSGELLRSTLDRIAKINRQLGGNRVTVSAVKKLLRDLPKTRDITFVDLGCGNGDMLRELADLGRAEGRLMKLIGIDANEATIDHAINLSTDYSEISFRKLDVFSDDMRNMDYDIALSTLFMHHFKEAQIEELLAVLTANARIGVVVNDLHRHPMAYYLFKGYSLFVKNEMVKNDGAISILRGFKKNDFQALANKLNLNSEIRWKWAFRYQWIIKPTIT